MAGWLFRLRCLCVCLTHRSSQQPEEVDSRDSLRHLEVEYHKSENSSRNLNSGTAKWINFFRPGITQILTAAGRSRFTLRASLRHLEVEYRESKNSSRILRGKWISLFRLGSVRICVWEKGAGLVRSTVYWPVATQYTKNTFKFGWMLLLFDRKITLNNSYLIGALNKI
jgi:hypothetical protein